VTDHDDNLPARVEEPIANPGLPVHHPRPTDIDEAAARRAERQSAAFFGLSMLCTVGFVVSFFAFDIGEDPDTFLGLGASNVALGCFFGGALLFLGIGIIQWARKLMSDHEIVEMRHAVASPAEDREAAIKDILQGIEDSGITRHRLLRTSLLGAVALVPIPAVVAMRDLYRGPLNGEGGMVDQLENTVWEPGTRIVNDVTGKPLKISDIEIGQLVNAEPEGLVHLHPGEPYYDPEVEYLTDHHLQVAKTKAAIILVRVEPKDIKHEETGNWGVNGVLAYSKICTHVGCPIALWEQQTHHLLCPCHQSTFDLTDAGRVVFGPAARALPQLEIYADSDGYLRAKGDFAEPVGPSYWERDFDER
jgi:ubiquinol-cytochrome c reductase iron-sulfur subunit